MILDAALWTYRARSPRILDGDTIEVECDTGFGSRHLVSVRLLGVDAPELDSPEGLDARSQLSRLVARGAGAWPLRVRTHRLSSGVEARSFARYVGTVWTVDADGAATDVGAAMAGKDAQP